MKASELRQSILQAAVQGKLVPQDSHDEPAEKLLERIRAEKAALIKEGKLKKEKPMPLIADDAIPYDLPAGWVWCRLSEICEVITDGDHQPPPKAEQGIPFLVISNISRGYFDFTNTRYVSRDYFDNLPSIKIAHRNDILFTVTGSWGIPVLVTDDRKFCFQRHIALIRLMSYMDIDYAYHFLLSPICYEQCRAVATGTAQKTVPLSGLRALIVPLPPIEEQRRIVIKINELMTFCDELEAAENELEALENHFIETLPKAILQMAVQGKLVPQDLHDEPAEKLLERIRAEKAKLIKGGKLKKEKPLPPIAEDEIPYDLPEGWVWCRLGEVISLLSGRDLETKHFNDEGNGIPYITGASAIDASNIIVSRWTNQPITVSRAGDLLITCKGTVGKMIFNNVGDCHIARQIMAVQFRSDNLLPDFVRTFLESYVHQLIIKAKSIIPGISREDMLFALMPLPPLAEQRRIVDKVNELMAFCDELKRAKTTPVTISANKVVPFPQTLEPKAEIGIAARGDAGDLPQEALDDLAMLFGDDTDG